MLGLWISRSTMAIILFVSLVVISDNLAHSAIIAVVESSLLLANDLHSPSLPLYHNLARRTITKFDSSPKSIPKIMSWLISSTAQNCNDPGCPLISISIFSVPCTVIGVPDTPLTYPVDSCSRS